MYYWQYLPDEERRRVLEIRKGRKLPWHSPPHLEFRGQVTFIISAACYLHKPIAGKSKERMEYCESELLRLCGETGSEVYAWCILPNHYHLLLRTSEIDELRRSMGRFHGRTSRQWNLEDDTPGRKTWFNLFDRNMRSARHFWATLNYIHNNPVKHGYVERWQDWEFSSAVRYLEEFGREKAEFIWKKYPVLDYGAGWDD